MTYPLIYDYTARCDACPWTVSGSFTAPSAASAEARGAVLQTEWWNQHQWACPAREKKMSPDLFVGFGLGFLAAWVMLWASYLYGRRSRW